jgi:hypothetical protein
MIAYLVVVLLLQIDIVVAALSKCAVTPNVGALAGCLCETNAGLKCITQFKGVPLTYFYANALASVRYVFVCVKTRCFVTTNSQH